MVYYKWNLGGSLNFVGTTGSLNADELNNTIDEVMYPLGAIIAFAKNMTGVPNTNPLSWAECNGQILNDTNSLYHGTQIPNLNGSSGGISRYLRGGLISGETGGSSVHRHSGTTTGPTRTTTTTVAAGTNVSRVDHTHTFTSAFNTTNNPPYYSVIWMMRIK